MSLESFHPAVARWFAKTLGIATPAQAEAWPAIMAGRHALIAAPTGSGKTLAAFLAAIDALIRQGLTGALKDETQVVYVSPLKALSNDIQRNLELPLAGIRDELANLGLPAVEVRTLVRSGDTPQAERERMKRKPPHIVVTTPESLYLLVTSAGGREILRTVRTVIVDEIHALAGNKRGAHLALTLERLQALVGAPLTRIGLSATQRPIEDIAHFLVGTRATLPDGRPDCTIIDTGHVRARDLAIEVPGSPLEAVMSGEVWEQVYDRIAELIREHRTTLVFVNTRRMAERVARHLADRLGEDLVTAHHGSLAKERRLMAETRLKSGNLRALVATASLELGIDIGVIDLVCQIGSTRAITTLVQRVGRSGRGLQAVPKGRVFALSRDDLVECAALVDAVRRGELDRLAFHPHPLDVFAQQIVAEVASQEWSEEGLYDLLRGAYPYRDLSRSDYLAVVHMLAEGYSTRRGRRSAYVHRDAVHGMLRARRGARLTALTSGGTIPDTADFQVVLEPAGHIIGTLNEDFAIESLPGDIFQLGNHSYRILRIEAGRVRVEDAEGQPPNIPFWLGEAPARTAELSTAVARLRHMFDEKLQASPEGGAARQWLTTEVGLTAAAANQIVDYLASARAALGVLPDQDTIAFERFFDESGGMQFIIHAPFGARINRAWGLALRKRFCRKFNFELQAAATEDAIILSLTTLHSFPLEEVAHYLQPETVRDILVQALLAAPMFTTRWRWNATVALAIPRMRAGKKTPPQLARMQAEDLVALVFPDQIACFENLEGDREVPDHPLVNQTLYDCLHEVMDLDGLLRLLTRLRNGDVRVVARDLTEPSPLALEILTARPYAFLDDAPLEERRTLAVQSRRWLDPQTAQDLGQLDPEAIARVREEAWPTAENADEVDDALMLLGFITAEEGAPWQLWFAQLCANKRAAALHAANGATLWIAAERVPQFQALYGALRTTPAITPPAEYAARVWTPEEALIEILRGRVDGLGPVTAAELAAPLGIPVHQVEAALIALEVEGYVLRGGFTPGAPSGEWCERRLLARVHRYTLARLRREIEPVTAREFLRFLFQWQRVLPAARGQGPDALAAVVAQLEGYEAPAAAWEGDILPARLDDYDPVALDSLCLAGRALWIRLTPRISAGGGPVRTTPIALVNRAYLAARQALQQGARDETSLSSNAQRVVEYLDVQGASFFDEIAEGTRLLKTQVEEALGELVAAGQVRSDSFSGLRALLLPQEKRQRFRGQRGMSPYGIEDAGRWVHIKRSPPLPQAGRDGNGERSSGPFPRRAGAHDAHPGGDGRGEGASWHGEYDPQAMELIARVLLKRYGVVFRRLLEREQDQLPPWRELLWTYRRLEARGDIRGGRFIAGFQGEQYALPEAITQLREIRRAAPGEAWVSLSGADPLNLVGILTPGPKVPALASNRVLYRDGLPIAVQIAGDARFLEKLTPAEEWQAQNALLRRAPAPGARAYLNRTA